MHAMLKVFTCLFLSCFALNSYAINVNVSTDSSVTGLGFTVNGAKHGGPGSSYQASDMPKGAYKFGVRADGKDIPCYVKGRRAVKLNHDANVTLMLKGRRCTGSM